MNYQNWLTVSALVLGSLSTIACDEKAEADEKPVVAPTAEAPEQKSAEQKVSGDEADTEAEKKAEEEAEKQAEVDENPITECCRMLGKKGFMERSPEYMDAAKSCGEALEAKQDMSSALAAIKKALKDKPLPSECAE